MCEKELAENLIFFNMVLNECTLGVIFNYRKIERVNGSLLSFVLVFLLFSSDVNMTVIMNWDDNTNNV